MVFYATFNSISVILRRQFTLFMSFLGFTSTRLGFEVSCPRTLPRKNPEDPVRLEPMTPGLRVKHFTTEPHGTLGRKHCGKRRNCLLRAISPFSHSVFKRLVSQGRQKVSLCENVLNNIISRMKLALKDAEIQRLQTSLQERELQDQSSVIDSLRSDLEAMIEKNQRSMALAPEF